MIHYAQGSREKFPTRAGIEPALEFDKLESVNSHDIVIVYKSSEHMRLCDRWFRSFGTAAIVMVPSIAILNNKFDIATSCFNPSEFTMKSYPQPVHLISISVERIRLTSFAGKPCPTIFGHLLLFHTLLRRWSAPTKTSLVFADEGLLKMYIFNQLAECSPSSLQCCKISGWLIPNDTHYDPHFKLQLPTIKTEANHVKEASQTYPRSRQYQHLTAPISLWSHHCPIQIGNSLNMGLICDHRQLF